MFWFAAMSTTPSPPGFLREFVEEFHRELERIVYCVRLPARYFSRNCPCCETRIVRDRSLPLSLLCVGKYRCLACNWRSLRFRFLGCPAPQRRPVLWRRLRIVSLRMYRSLRRGLRELHPRHLVNELRQVSPSQLLPSLLSLPAVFFRWCRLGLRSIQYRIETRSFGSRSGSRSATRMVLDPIQEMLSWLVLIVTLPVRLLNPAPILTLLKRFSIFRCGFCTDPLVPVPVSRQPLLPRLFFCRRYMCPHCQNEFIRPYDGQKPIPEWH